MNAPVTVLVCAYNDESTIGIVLQALAQLTYSPLEILVINDASTDRTAQIAQQFPVTLINNETNRGLGFNLNLGLSRAKGEYLAVVQSDCEVLGANWLDQMVESMKENTAVVVSQRRITDFASLPAGARYFNAVAPQDLQNATGKPVELEYSRGKADLYRTSVLRELNGWNRSFFTAGEDTDLSIRIRQKGQRILLQNSATVRYLFSGRQATVLGALKKAFLYGKTAAMLHHLHGYDGIQARTYLTLLLSIPVLFLPPMARWICGILSFCIFSYLQNSDESIERSAVRAAGCFCIHPADYVKLTAQSSRFFDNSGRFARNCGSDLSWVFFCKERVQKLPERRNSWKTSSDVSVLHRLAALIRCRLFVRSQRAMDKAIYSNEATGEK